MKRCPKCNRTYTTNTQKFCTHDGGILEGVDMSTETVRIDAQDAPTQAISAGLGHDIPAQFDPFQNGDFAAGDCPAKATRDSRHRAARNDRAANSGAATTPSSGAAG